MLNIPSVAISLVQVENQLLSSFRDKVTIYNERSNSVHSSEFLLGHIDHWAPNHSTSSGTIRPVMRCGLLSNNIYARKKNWDDFNFAQK